ncbi:hAT family dimerization protein [Ceratobasidium sp. AG-Ba]|nr:hAT family dimerization protein [Ceratobasidium sp. AG-Ba]
MFFEILEEFGVTKKLGLITLDNASNSDTLMAQLEAYMVKQGLDFDRHGNRLRCFPHVINLGVQTILPALPSSSQEFRKSAQRFGQKIDDQLERYLLALESEPHNRTSDTIHERNEAQLWRTHKLVDGVWRLEEFQMKLVELILDCPTRWSSTRDVIHRFLDFYPAASRYIASDPSLANHAITHMDYEVLSDVLDVLNLRTIPKSFFLQIEPLRCLLQPLRIMDSSINGASSN